MLLCVNTLGLARRARGEEYLRRFVAGRKGTAPCIIRKMRTIFAELRRIENTHAFGQALCGVFSEEKPRRRFRKDPLKTVKAHPPAA